jgi:regulator of RNase E activity RraA
MQDLIKEIKKENIRISTSTVSDVMDDYGLFGVLPANLTRHNRKNQTIIGQAYTVDWKPVRKSANIMAEQRSTWEQVKNFLVPDVSDGTGKIYVSGAGELLTSAALAGGLSSTYFQNIGFEGIVLGGAVRDAFDLENLDIPVIASNLIPTDTQGSFYVSEVGTSTIIENTVINTGDIIICDLTGSVVIPLSVAYEVLKKSMAIDMLENNMLGKLTNNLFSMIEEKGRI